MPKNQKGIATLLVTLVILALATILVLYTNKITFADQKSTVSQYRAIQSLQTADAALNFAIAQIQKDPGTYIDASGSNKGMLKTSMQSSLLAADGTVCTEVISGTCPTAVNLIPTALRGKYAVYGNSISSKALRLTALGCAEADTSCDRADQSYARVTVDMVVSKAGFNSPFSAQGCVNFPTSTLTANVMTSSTLPGDPLELGRGTGCFSVATGSYSNHTKPWGAGNPSYNNSVASYENPDICDNASACSPALSGDGYFESYFGMSKSAKKALGTTVVLTPAQFQSLCSGSSQTINGTTYTGLNSTTPGTTFWVDGYAGGGSGNISITGSCTAGSITAPNKPINLVVDGSLSMTGSMTMNGFLYGIGTGTAPKTMNLGIAGSLTVNGAMAIEGALNSTGAVSVSHEDAWTAGLGLLTGWLVRDRVPGKWRDY